MRETEFIAQNNEKWKELEALNKQKSKDPVKLSDLFIEVTNDLSFSKTHYANRSIKVYLNNLALGIHSRVYRNRLSASGKFKEFWANDLPKVMYESRRAVLLATILFVVAMAIGVLSSINDPGFARQILGDSYVQMTEEFIESGDPMAVYKKSKNIDMFVYISINNIYVSFLVFVLGAFFSVGTISVIMYNGVMVGTFQYFFIERGLFRESFLTIWMHGMPEIMSIVLAGAAGLTLGSGLIFPGTYGRKESFLITARRGIMMMIGIVPVLLFAAFIEGFATRYTEIPDIVRLIIILFSGTLMVYYFVIYPWKKFHAKSTSSEKPALLRYGLPILLFGYIVYRVIGIFSAGDFNILLKWVDVAVVGWILAMIFVLSPQLTAKRRKAQSVTVTSRQELPAATIHNYDWQKDKKNNMVYSDIFAIYADTIFYLLGRFFAVAIAYVGVLYLWANEGFQDIFTSNVGGGFDMFSSALLATFVKVDQLFRYGDHEFMYLLNSVTFTVVALIALWKWAELHRKTNGLDPLTIGTFVSSTLPSTLFVSLVANTIFFIPTPYSFFVMLVAMPPLLQILIHPIVAPTSGEGLAMTINQAFSYYGRQLGLFLMTFVTAVLFLLVFSSGLVDYLLQFLFWNFKLEADTFNLLMLGVRAGLTILALCMVIPLFIYGSAFGHLAAFEMRTASGLRAAVARIGTVKRAYGLLKEES